jgi:hypothetical protein
MSSKNKTKKPSSSRSAKKPASPTKSKQAKSGPKGSGSAELDPPGTGNLSLAVHEYASSLANPFASGPSCGIPDLPALMTRKSKVFTRGTFQTSSNAGAQGCGFIVTSPCAAVAGDANSVTINNPATFSAPVIDLINAAQFVALTSNSDYVTADIGQANIVYRVVSHGIRIRNISPMVNRGGIIVGLHEPSHTCLEGFTIPTLDGYLEAGRMSDTQEWTTLTYRPIETSDFNYRPILPPVPAAGAYDTYYMGFIVQAPSPALIQTYEFEVFTNLETQGRLAVGKTPSHADPVGNGAVNAMTAFSAKLHSPSQEDPGTVAEAFVKGVSHYVDHHMTHPSKDREKKKDSSVWSNVIGALPSVASTIFSLI